MRRQGGFDQPEHIERTQNDRPRTFGHRLWSALSIGPNFCSFSSRVLPSTRIQRPLPSFPRIPILDRRLMTFLRLPHNVSDRIGSVDRQWHHVGIKFLFNLFASTASRRFAESVDPLDSDRRPQLDDPPVSGPAYTSRVATGLMSWRLVDEHPIRDWRNRKFMTTGGDRAMLVRSRFPDARFQFDVFERRSARRRSPFLPAKACSGEFNLVMIDHASTTLGRSSTGLIATARTSARGQPT